MCDFDMSLACLTWFGLTRQCLCQFGRRNWQCLRKSYISSLVAPLPHCGVGGTGTPPNWAVHCCEPQFSDISKYRVLSFLTGQRIIHIPGDKSTRQCLLQSIFIQFSSSEESWYCCHWQKLFSKLPLFLMTLANRISIFFQKLNQTG